MKSLCVRYTNTCGENSAKAKIVRIYGEEPFIGGNIVPIMEHDVNKVELDKKCTPFHRLLMSDDQAPPDMRW